MKTHNYGFFKDGKIFRKGFLEYPDREIGEVRGSEDETMQYFIDRFQIAKNKVETLEKQIEEAENKGSYLMKLLHLRTFLSEFDGLGDFVPLYEKLDTLEKQLRELISVNRVKNLEIKRALIAEAEEARKIEDDREAFDKFDDIRERWIKTGSVDKQYEEETEGRFSELVQEHFDRKRANYEKKKAETNERIKKYERIIAMADKLRWERDKRVATGELKKLQAEWKRVGPIPAIRMKTLWRQFKSINDFIFRKGKPTDRFQQRRPFVRENFEESIKKKEQLIFLVDKLRGKTDDETVEEIKRLQRIWSGSGKVPPDKYRELSNMFFGACDDILERSYLEKLVRSKDVNYDEKSTQEKIRSKITVLQDQIWRDEKELETMNDSQKMNAHRGQMDKILMSKMSSKRRKLFVKRKILTQLNNTLEKN